MKVITSGHKYELENYENKQGPGQVLQFIEKVPDSDKLKTIHDGTTNEEILKVLIDRLKFLNAKLACNEDFTAITSCEAALKALDKRSMDRKQRKVEGTMKP